MNEPALAPGVVLPMRIESGDLVLRRWEPQDLQARFEAVRASYEPLHQWMDWTAEPPTIEQQAEFGEMQERGWPSDGSFNFGIFDAQTGAVLGMAGVHDHLGPGAVEIGYWCHVDHTGRGVITRAAALLTAASLDLAGIGWIEIHCDEANVRSAAVARRLGYRLDRIELDGIEAPAEVGRGMVWIMERAAFAGSPAERIAGGRAG
ncbi:MAG TPA: GNAT family protein [Actinocrinis sp.]|nr:GNAT family protein [Actinocrinis sp.]